MLLLIFLLHFDVIFADTVSNFEPFKAYHYQIVLLPFKISCFYEKIEKHTEYAVIGQVMDIVHTFEGVRNEPYDLEIYI